MIALDNDARDYFALRRGSGAALSAAALDAVQLRQEELRLRPRYGHGPRMWAERLVSPAGGLPRHYVLDPQPEPRGTILYIHGGGWVMGEPEDYLPVCRALAAASDWRFIVTDYAKAPEQPFPAGYTECLRLAESLIEPGSCRAGGATHHFAVAGDSAGGGMAAALAHELSHSSPGALSAQILITPVLDARLDRPSYLDSERQLSLTRDTMSWFFDQYAPSPTNRADERISPLRAESLRFLPATLIISAGTDVLASEIEEYVSRLQAAHVAVRQRDFPGQMHGFFQLYNVMNSSRVAIEWIAAQLRELDALMERRTTKGWLP